MLDGGEYTGDVRFHCFWSVVPPPRGVMTRGIVALFVWLAVINSQASAGDTIPWANVGDWRIAADPSVAGCFMFASTTKGTVVRMGIDSSQKKGYLLIGNSDWRSVDVGREYGLTFQFDGEPSWKGMFTGKKMGSSLLLAIHVDGKFMHDFATKKLLVIYYEDRVVTRLPLTGSLAAMQSVVQCQAKVDSIESGQNDPFSKRDVAQPPLDLGRPNNPFSGGGVRRANDPFSSL
jgi:hypothetical protein